MKYVMLFCALVLSNLFARCYAQNKVEQDTVEYNFGMDVSEANKKLFIERAEKGKILYKIHCTDCHGIFTKAKDSIPDFTKQQIDNYQARSIMAFKSHAKVRGLSYEQLDYILSFLRLRKVEK